MVLHMNRIVELRKERGMKQAELADAVHTSRQSVGKWENGDIDLSTDTISKLCAFFGVTADYLLGLSGQRTFRISDEDAALVEAYHAAPEHIRESIEVLLRPFREAGTSSALSDEQEGERHG